MAASIIDNQITTFEKALEKIDAKLDRLGLADVRLASVEAKLDLKASRRGRRDQGSLKYRPTIWQMIPLVIGIMGAAFAIVRDGVSL